MASNRVSLPSPQSLMDELAKDFQEAELISFLVDGAHVVKDPVWFPTVIRFLRSLVYLFLSGLQDAYCVCGDRGISDKDLLVADRLADGVICVSETRGERLDALGEL